MNVIRNGLIFALAATLVPLPTSAQPAAGVTRSAFVGTSNDQIADSLYAAGRQALQQRDYRRAATLFRQVHARNVKAPVAADALYWHSFALYRLGGGTNLRDALASLSQLEREHPRYTSVGDARALRVQVCGALAGQGDERCASEVRVAADPRQGSQGAQASQGSQAPRQGTQPSQQECPDEDEDERIAALNALLQMDSDQALPILERVLARRDRCSVTLRRKAVFLVSQKREDKAIDLLMTAVRTDPDAEVREQAVFWLGQTGSERAVDLLQDIIRRETDEDVLKKAVFSLSQHRSARAGTILRDLAQRNDAPVDVRSEAIFWLAQGRGGRENMPLLTALYTRVTQEELKEKIVFSVSQISGAESGKWLLDLAVNEREDTEMRKKALFWLGQGKRTSAAELVGLYARMTDREMREQLIFVYSQRREADFVDKLLDIARNERDRELRSKAVFWLSQSKDARVLKFLEELINK